MAINRNELRLGNCLNYQNYTVRVDSISRNYGFTCIGDEVFPPDNFDIEPIPLTEELLLKFGFVKDGPYYVNHKISISKNMIRDGSGNFNGFYCSLQFRDAFEKHYIQLLYFHQLQNLYFLLTGTELVLSGSANF